MKYTSDEIIKMDATQLRVAVAEAQGFANAYMDKNLGWCGYTSVGDRFRIPDPTIDIDAAMKLEKNAYENSGELIYVENLLEIVTGSWKIGDQIGLMAYFKIAHASAENRARAWLMWKIGR